MYLSLWFPVPGLAIRNARNAIPFGTLDGKFIGHQSIRTPIISEFPIISEYPITSEYKILVLFVRLFLLFLQCFLLFCLRIVSVECSAVGSAQHLELCASVERIEHFLLLLVLDVKDVLFGEGVILLHFKFGLTCSECFSEFLCDDFRP